MNHLNKRPIILLCLIPGLAVSAEQVITAVPTTESVTAGQTVSVPVYYSSENPQNENLTGLGLRLHWNSSKLTFVDVSKRFAEHLVATGLPEADALDFDADPETDAFIQFAWADVNGHWPGSSASFPLALYTANFTVSPALAAGTVAPIHFSTSSTAAGFEWQPSSATLTVADASEFISLASVTLNHQWHPIAVESFSDDSVIIAAPPSFNGTDPGVVRLRKTLAGFEMRFQEWAYLDGVHTHEAVPYLVLKKGRHTMSDGSVWEVGTFDLDGTAQWRNVPFQHAFSTTPKLFLTAQTRHGSQAVSVRARQLTGLDFEAALFEEEHFMNGHKRETVAYLAIHSPGNSGTLALGNENLPYTLQQIVVQDQWQAVPNLGSSLKIEEEQSADTETAHTGESVDVLALGPYLFAQDISAQGGDSMALRQKPVND